MELKPTSSSSIVMNEETFGGDSGSVWLERDDHPLLNTLILDTLFGFVKRYDLKACRGVCRRWNLLTIPHMRDTFEVTIYGSQYGEFVSIYDYRRVDQFLELFGKNGLEIPFDTFNLGLGPGPFCSLGQQFLTLCGETAKEIHLINMEESDFPGIEHVSKLLRSTPNLQVFGFPSHYCLTSNAGNIVKLFPDSNAPTLPCLKKVIFPHDEAELAKLCPTLIQEFLTAASKISEIVVQDASTISAVLNVIEKLGKESSIQSLNFDDAGNEHIGHLRRINQKENGLKLKNLTFYPNTYYGGDELQQTERQVQLAEIFKDTLEFLDIQFSARDELEDFPIMPRLKSLSLRVYNDLGPSPVNLNNLFPALETFSIAIEVPNYEADWPNFFRQFGSCPNMKALTVESRSMVDDYLVNYMSLHTFLDILRVFPNLTKLDLGGTDIGCDTVPILSEIWTQMTQLESLSISGDLGGNNEWTKQIQSADSLFTGIPTRALKEIRHFVNELDKMTAEGRRKKILVLTDQLSRRPSIRNLTNLKFLKLQVATQGDESILTDLTAYLAFYSMKHLCHLTVELCGFTKDCCEILRDETGLESRSFKNHRENIIPPILLRQTKNNYI